MATAGNIGWAVAGFDKKSAAALFMLEYRFGLSELAIWQLSPDTFCRRMSAIDEEFAMHMTIQDFHARFPGRTLIPAEYAGQWIAWNEDRTRIVANGTDYSEVYEQAVRGGCARPVLHKVARAPLVGLA